MKRVPKAISPAVPALLAALLLGGCDTLYREDISGRLPTSWVRLDAEDYPVVLPAERGIVPVAARTRRMGNIFQSYRMVLPNPTTLAGENRLNVDVEYVPTSVFEMLDQPPRAFPIPLYTATTLEAALQTEFPGMETEMAEAPRRGRYGIYDYAVARGDGSATCVLAWQLLDDRKRVLPESIKAIRLEWRYCGQGAEPLALLRPFERLSLTVAPDILPAEPAVVPASAREIPDETPPAAPTRVRR